MMIPTKKTVVVFFPYYLDISVFEKAANYIYPSLDEFFLIENMEKSLSKIDYQDLIDFNSYFINSNHKNNDVFLRRDIDSLFTLLNADDKDGEAIHVKDILEFKPYTLSVVKDDDINCLSPKSPNDDVKYKTYHHNILLAVMKPGLGNIVLKYGIHNKKEFLENISEYVFRAIKDNFGLKEALMSNYNLSRLY